VQQLSLQSTRELVTAINAAVVILSVAKNPRILLLALAFGFWLLAFALNLEPI
jgi:hypothetical protein